MLVEIYCSEFKSNGVERPAIQFHTGLNIILGDDNRSNSVGKSTFLMILDFVFGGNDYINKCQDVHKNVPAHTICFTFQFDNQLYYFSRSTKDYRHVVKCDSKYKPIREKKPLSLDAYGGFLADKYGIMIQGLTWRGAVGPFIHVYKRETMDVERPIQHAKREKPEKAIQAYMQLYDKYQAVQEQIFRAQKAEEDFKVFDQSQKRQFVRTAKNEKEFQRNEATARKLEAREKELSVNSDRGLLDVDSVKAHQLLQLNELLSGYRKQRTQVKAQLDAVRAEISEGRNDFKRKYSDLERFFPGIEFRAIEEVECFHRSLSEILIDEYHETERALSATYSMLSNEIEQIEIQIEEVENISNVSQAVLHEYAEIITELNNTFPTDGTI